MWLSLLLTQAISLVFIPKLFYLFPTSLFFKLLPLYVYNLLLSLVNSVHAESLLQLCPAARGPTALRGETFPFVLKISGNNRSEDPRCGTSPPDQVLLLPLEELMQTWAPMGGRGGGGCCPPPAPTPAALLHPGLVPVPPQLEDDGPITQLTLRSCMHLGDQAQSPDLETGRRPAHPHCTTGAIPWASSGEKEGISAWGANSSGCLRPRLSALECQSDNTARERTFKGAADANSNPVTCPRLQPKTLPKSGSFKPLLQLRAVGWKDGHPGRSS